MAKKEEYVMNDATKQVDVTELECISVEVEFNTKSKPIKLESVSDKDLLFLKARVHFGHEAGSYYFMKVKVNGKYLKKEHLLNKPPEKIIADRRKSLWFKEDINSWRVCYSPNYKYNYTHRKYKVMNGDAYIFIFDISSFLKNKKYKIIIEHSSLPDHPAFENTLIISDLHIF